MTQFLRVARVDDVPSGSCREVEFDGRVVALFNVGGQIHALDGICPHAGGPLGEGELNGSVVTCPWHGWQFDVTSGQNVRSSTLKQRLYQVKVENGEILLAQP